MNGMSSLLLAMARLPWEMSRLAVGAMSAALPGDPTWRELDNRLRAFDLFQSTGMDVLPRFGPGVVLRVAVPSERVWAPYQVLSGSGTPLSSYAPVFLDTGFKMYVYVSAMAKHYGHLRRSRQAMRVLEIHGHTPDEVIWVIGDEDDRTAMLFVDDR